MVTGLIARMMDQLRQFACGLHGHDALLHFEAARLSMRCMTCGYETPGWDLKAPHIKAATAPKARVLRLPLVREGRVA